MEQAASALAYMHAMQPRPILHRDLKPANILLFENHTVAKLADSCLARVINDVDDDTMIGNTGTQSYMAPEVRKFSNLIGLKILRYSLETNTRVPVMSTHWQLFYGRYSVVSAHIVVRNQMRSRLLYL